MPTPTTPKEIPIGLATPFVAPWFVPATLAHPPPTPPPTEPPLPPPPPAPEPDGPAARFLRDPGAFLSEVLDTVTREAAKLGRAVLPFVIALVALAIVAAIVTWVRRRAQRGEAAFVDVAAPPEVDPAGAAALWQSLHRLLHPRPLRWPGSRPHVAFELHVTPGRLRVGWWVPPGVNAHAVARAIEAAWPGSRVHLTTALNPAGSPQQVWGAELHLSRPEWLPLAYDHDADPYRQLLAAAADVVGGEQTVVHVLVRPASGRRLGRARRGVHRDRTGAPRGRLARLIAFWRPPPPPPPRPVPPDPLRQAEVRAAVTKLATAVAFEVAVRYAVTAPAGARDGRRRLRGRAAEVAAAFGSYANVNSLRPRRLWRPARVMRDRSLGRGALLGLDELMALAHLPREATVAGWAQAGVRPVGPPLGVLDANDFADDIWGRDRWARRG